MTLFTGFLTSLPIIFFFITIYQNIKEGGWSSYLTIPSGIDKEKLETSEVFIIIEIIPILDQKAFHI